MRFTHIRVLSCMFYSTQADLERGQEFEPEDLGPGHQPSTWPNMTPLTSSPFTRKTALKGSAFKKRGKEFKYCFVLQSMFCHKGESYTCAFDDFFFFGETNLEGLHILLNLFKVQCSLASSQLSHTVKSFTSREKHKLGSCSTLSGLRPSREGRGNFEKEGKVSQGACRHAISGCMLQIPYSV